MMRGARAQRALLTCVAAAFSGIGACADTTPAEYVPEPEPDASSPPVPLDAAGDGEGSTASSPCLDCLSEDASCRADYEACLATDQCSELLECLLHAGCLSYANVDDRIACATGNCFESFGIVTGEEPFVQAIIPLHLCTLGACTDACITR